jgi:DNA polymerase, archaea type
MENDHAMTDAQQTTIEPAAVTGEALNRYLYGSDPTERIVAVERGGSDRVRVYRRVDGQVEEERASFRPWLLMTHEPAWAELAKDVRATRLAGDADYCWFVECRHWNIYQDVRTRLRDAGEESLVFNSPVQQYLISSGRTLFKGMIYDDLLRLQLDIEATSLDPSAPNARVFLVSARTSGGEERLFGASGEDEATILDDLTAFVRDADPDIIEGHNIFNYDFPYLLARAAACGVTLTWGRDGSALRVGTNARAQFKVGARSIPYQQHFIYGRHIIDTYQQIQRYDVAGTFSSYGLKNIIEALGYTRDEREFIPGQEIARVWEEDPTRVIRYALDDVRDVAVLSELSVPTEFYQSQIVPDALQDIATSGPGEKINDLMVRIYLGERQSIPRPEASRDYPGGYADVLRTGVFKPVVKCDVASMYPSIMLTWRIGSRRDPLRVTLPLLKTLTERRLHAKAETRRASGRERGYWQGIQGSFKVLINSFYGNLGYSRAFFNDFAAAADVTLRGQEIIKSVVRELESHGATPIEVDTDGVYFVPPPSVAPEEAEEERFLKKIADALPAGIELAYDGSYMGMVSLKMKNYALIDRDGHTILKGSSLRSRREEPILRAFLQQAITLFVEGSNDAVRDLYLDFAERIQRKAYEPREICRWETVTEKTFSSESNRRLAEAARGVAVGERLEVYQRIDGTLGRLENYAGDEDTSHMLRRLHDMAERFAELFEDSRDREYHFPLLTAGSDIATVRAARPVKQLGLF